MSDWWENPCKKIKVQSSKSCRLRMSEFNLFKFNLNLSLEPLISYV